MTCGSYYQIDTVAVERTCTSALSGRFILVSSTDTRWAFQGSKKYMHRAKICIQSRGEFEIYPKLTWNWIFSFSYEWMPKVPDMMGAKSPQELRHLQSRTTNREAEIESKSMESHPRLWGNRNKVQWVILRNPCAQPPLHPTPHPQKKKKKNWQNMHTKQKIVYKQ